MGVPHSEQNASARLALFSVVFTNIFGALKQTQMSPQGLGQPIDMPIQITFDNRYNG
jgi:hypothetical protein